MRKTLDRIRHAIAFELIGLIMIVVILAQFDFDIIHTGIMGVFFSFFATVWNYIYNIIFDKIMIKRYGTSVKTPLQRIFHAILFELGLLVVSLPILAWWMKISIWQAFILDIGLVIFYVFYAYIFNYVYDKLFPIINSK